MNRSVHDPAHWYCFAAQDIGLGATIRLVADDEPRIADTLATILRNFGYEASVAYDAPSAISQCEPFNPELVITDVVMPGMNGVEMAIQVRRLQDSAVFGAIDGFFRGRATNRKAYAVQIS